MINKFTGGDAIYSVANSLDSVACSLRCSGFNEYKLIYTTFSAAGMKFGERKSSPVIEIEDLGGGCDLEWIAP